MLFVEPTYISLKFAGTLELFNTSQKIEKLGIAQPSLKVALLVENPLH